MKIAQVQLSPKSDKLDSIDSLRRLIDSNIKSDVDFITLPEMFVCPYEMDRLSEYAEPDGGSTWRACSSIARENKAYLVAGTIPELSEKGKIYNTVYVFDRKGIQIAKYRKLHLFDINIKNGQHFRESDTLSPGKDIVIFETGFGTMGLAVCYDIRFPELFRLLELQGSKVVFVPASFNMTTGPAHWELMFRAQSVFNQLYMVGTSTANSESASYKSWGHSIITDPWGTVVGQMNKEEGVLITNVDLKKVEQVRNQLPLINARRTDIYNLRRL